MRMRWLGRPSVVVAVLLVVLAVIGGRLTASAVNNQEQRLLKERANEVNLVLATSIGSLSEGLGGIGAVLRATNESPIAFERTAAPILATTTNASVGEVKPSGSGFVVVLAQGPGLTKGQLLTGARAAAISEAARTGKLTPTVVIGSGNDRALGFALGPPATPPGTVLYRQTALGPLKAPRAAATAPFSEIRLALYAAPKPDAKQAVVATGGSATVLPLKGRVVTLPFPVGVTPWSLQVSADRPLVGGLARSAGWIVTGAGILIALLVGSVIESATRRRDSAVALYASEHRLAENLQRSFLPDLPEVDGLDIAARYLTGSSDQQVGGDWYDVFPLGDGEFGVVIGDVLGHDVDAAVIMSRIQTALRAFACRGDEPGAVLDVLDEHIRTVQGDRLTTVFYGVLAVPDATGARAFRFANAGHLHPVVRHPDGSIDELVTTRSVLLGVPGGFGTGRTQSEISLTPGSVLLFFTDGLVEVPDVSITDSIDELKAAARDAPRATGSEAMCDLLIAGMRPGDLRDDVAVLAITLVDATRPATGDAATSTTSV